MSGDVQPRKRKDKKRKKDDVAEEIAHPITAVAPPNDDLNIHIHKERSTGGGFCAKFVFFILLAVLAVLIGLIITEHRGLTDLDTIGTESRFSQIFDGWIDDSPAHDEHDDDEISHSKEIESHEEEDEEEHKDDDDDAHNDEDENNSEDEEESLASDEEEAEEDESVEEDQEDTLEEEDDDNSTIDNAEDTVEETIEEDTYEQQSEEDADDNDEEEDEDNVLEDNEVDQSVENSQESQEDQTLENEDDNIIDDDNKDTEDELEDKSEEKAEDAPKEETVDNNSFLDQTNSGVVKIGVGVSLLVVAYIVLVRKWKTDKGKASIAREKTAVQETLPDLSRRKTLVIPPSLEQIQQELESGEEDYSEEERDAESDEGRLLAPATKRQYQELQSMYLRSLSPDGEPDKTATFDDDEEEREPEIEYDEEGEEEEDEDEEEEEEDDEELLKRLEEKYGRIQHSDEEEEEREDDERDDYDDYEKLESWKRTKEKSDSDAEEEWSTKRTGAQEAYHSSNITNSDDWDMRHDLDNAQERLPQSPADALNLFNKILGNFPKSPRALYGKAQSLDTLAEKTRSNKFLQEAIVYYLKLLNSPKVLDPLFNAAAERCINRMRFIGHYGRAVDVHKLLMERFPDVPKYPNQLAVTYLTINKIQEAKILLFEVLSKWPQDGLALVHYGFILKANDNNFKDAIKYLQQGIQTRDPGVIDGRFFFHLGDALARLGRVDEATKVYEAGVLDKVFLSKHQRSLYNVNRLKAMSWWAIKDFPGEYKDFFELLQSSWKKIRDEGLLVLNRRNSFKDEAENLRDKGDWKQFELFARGAKHAGNCQKCPETCKIVESLGDAWKCRRGQVKFSVMEPGTHVWPHCGPTNCRLRVHLGLKVPPNTHIRVADETRTWNEGQLSIFDDSFEHEVWHNGTEFRLILIVDVWHPELTQREKATLSSI